MENKVFSDQFGTHNGQKSWESFVIFAKDIIQQIKEKYKDS